MNSLFQYCRLMSLSTQRSTVELNRIKINQVDPVKTTMDAPLHPSDEQTLEECPVCSHNEWDPLEEVIVGNVEGFH